MAIFRLGLLSRRLLGSLTWGLFWGLANSLSAAGQPVGMVQSKAQIGQVGGPTAVVQVNGLLEQQGDRLVVNGVALAVPWGTWQSQGRTVFGVSDVALLSLGGIDLLDTQDPSIQPVAWRESLLAGQPQQLNLSTLVTRQARYLDLTPLIEQAGWTVQLAPGADGEQTLKVQTPSISQVANLLLGRALGHRFRRQDIQWSPGIRWQQQYVRQGGAAFPVTLLRFRLGSQADAVALAPIWPADEDIAGIEPLLSTAAANQVAAAINGGFFNRNNQTPLGAIRQGGRWVSGPILNRGAIAWDEQGNVAMARVKLQESLVVNKSQTRQPQDNVGQTVEPGPPPKPVKFSLISLNSGYLKAGFSRYSEDWGTHYVPLTDNEVLIYVKNGQVIEQREAQLAGEGRFPIPQGNSQETFLVVARSFRSGAAQLPVGTKLRLQQQISPPEFVEYPHVLGGGPLLLKEGQVVLDAAVEGFSKAFAEQGAVRSAAVTFTNGDVALVTVHERIAGKGATLNELARLLQAMGGQDAINLDGGSSTQLVLGGQMINRNPRSAARVHNGLGLFQGR